MGVVARRPGRRDASCERAKARSDDILHESFHASSSSRARSREGRRSDARSFDRTRRRAFVVSRHATRARDDANDDRGDEGFPKCRAVERPRATRVHAVRSRATSIPSTRSHSIARTRSIANSTARTRANRTFLTFDPRGRRRRTKILDGSVWCVRARAFVVRERRERERENRPTDQNRRDRVARRHLEGRKGELVGEDELGNKYYQDVSSQQGRNRWVVPPNADDYSAANVPRGWHGWLHHANDEPGLPDAAAPTYEDDAPRFARGTSSAGTYLPKGHFSRAKPGEVTRSWARYQSWTPDR